MPDDKLIIFKDNIYYSNLNTIKSIGSLFVSEIIVGSYNGDGTQQRTINIDATPRYLFVFLQNGATMYNLGGGSDNRIFGGFAYTNNPVKSINGYDAIKIINNGFIVTYNYNYGIFTNFSSTSIYTYYYFAIV